jgi:exonuclease III
VIAKVEPLNVTFGFGSKDLDSTAGVITIEFASMNMVACYSPNSGSPGIPRSLEDRLKFDNSIQGLLKKVSAMQKPLMWIGDLNVASRPQDYHPDAFIDALDAKDATLPGFLPSCSLEEIASFTKLCGMFSGTDAWEQLHPDDKADKLTGFTWLKDRPSRKQGIGLRVDHFVCSPELFMDRVPFKTNPAKTWVTGIDVLHTGSSDHLPLKLTLGPAAAADVAIASSTSETLGPETLSPVLLARIFIVNGDSALNKYYEPDTTKVLVDSGSTYNLIPEEFACKVTYKTAKEASFRTKIFETTGTSKC